MLQALKTSFSQLEEKTKLELQLLQSNPQFWNTALRDKLLRVSQLFSSQATDQIHFNDAESRWAYLGTYTAAHATLVQATFTSGRFEPLTEFIKNSHSKERSVVSNGNRTEWSPIRSVITRVINKIGRPCSGSPICLITSMITDRIGRHEVLLPINHNLNKICDILQK